MNSEIGGTNKNNLLELWETEQSCYWIWNKGDRWGNPKKRKKNSYIRTGKALQIKTYVHVNHMYILSKSKIITDMLETLIQRGQGIMVGQTEQIPQKKPLIEYSAKPSQMHCRNHYNWLHHVLVRHRNARGCRKKGGHSSHRGQNLSHHRRHLHEMLPEEGGIYHQVFPSSNPYSLLPATSQELQTSEVPWSPTPTSSGTAIFLQSTPAMEHRRPPLSLPWTSLNCIFLD